jgi:small subunit ribosomal protein S2
MSERIERLHELRRLRDDGQLELLPPKERMAMLSELDKLDANLGGVADMRRQPDAVFIVDLRKEQLAVREARRLGLPIVALVDTNCDPDEADYVIPGNDDAIRSCSLIIRAIADGVAAGQTTVSAAELERPRDADNGKVASERAPAEADEPAAPPAEEAETTPEPPAAEADSEPAVEAKPEPPAAEAVPEPAAEAPEPTVKAAAGEEAGE